MYSLGEIEAECRKAAKGVGLTWGLAEEAGLIARHLSEFKLPGSDAIYMTLKWIQDNGLSESQLGLSFLKKKNQNLNGLLLGVTLLDRLVALIDQDLIIRDPVIGPLAVVGAILRFQNEK